MNFKTTNNPNEFDFSIKSTAIDKNCTLHEGDKPDNICDEIFCALLNTITEDSEIRYVGLIENEDFIINRCYKRNGRVWENIYYDDLVEMLENIKDFDIFHRIHNHLIY